MLCFKRKKSCTGCKIPRMWEKEGLTLTERCHNEAQQKQRRKAKIEEQIASRTDDVKWNYEIVKKIVRTFVSHKKGKK